MFRPIATGVLVTATLVLAPMSSAFADNGGPNNIAQAQASGNNNFAHDGKTQVERYQGNNLTSENAAVAYGHDCTGCRVVAIAFQGVLVEGQPSSQTPQNYAYAVNYKCDSCDTAAWARQVIVQTGVTGDVQLTDAAHQDVDRIHHDVEQLAQAGATMTDDQIAAQVDTLWSAFNNDLCNASDYRTPNVTPNCAATPVQTQS